MRILETSILNQEKEKKQQQEQYISTLEEEVKSLTQKNEELQVIKQEYEEDKRKQ